MAPRGRKARVNPKKKAKDNTPEHKALKELWQHLERSEAQGTNPHHPGWLYQCKRNEKGKISRLDLSESSQISLPASIGTFTSLRLLDLSNCTSLTSLPPELGRRRSSGGSRPPVARPPRCYHCLRSRSFPPRWLRAAKPHSSAAQFWSVRAWCSH